MQPNTKRVLIVDDEANVALTIGESIRTLGNDYHVDIANDGNEALALAGEHAYDVLLTDYRMPGMNGVELAQAVKQRNPETQIILMTAYGSDSLRNSCKTLPLYEFIEKPFSIPRLRQLIAEAVDANAIFGNLAFIIEDTEDIATLFSRALTIEGFRVEIISDGIRARQRLNEDIPSLIVLDLHLPGVDGNVLLHEIRSDERLQNTVVFLASADALLADFNGPQADLVLQKPITFSQLRDLSRRFKR